MQEKNREISVIKQKILQYLENQGISKYECYQKTGIVNGVLSQKGGISEENLMKFLNYFSDISPDWLFFGRGKMLKSYENGTSQSIVGINNFENLVNTVNELKEQVKNKDNIIDKLIKQQDILINKLTNQ